ncbi:MAG: Mov34/MPN/PAD-1 family protein [Promethearchaeota archaeon]
MKYQKDLIFKLDQQLLNELIICVKNADPNEACGLIFGLIKEIEVERGYQYQYLAKHFECIKSSQRSPVSFLIDNFEVFNKKFQEAYEKYNMQLVSIFHSHPGGAYPSGIDRNHMIFLDKCGLQNFKNQIWTILDATNNELNGFIYLQKEFIQINVQIKIK